MSLLKLNAATEYQRMRALNNRSYFSYTVLDAGNLINFYLLQFKVPAGKLGSGEDSFWSVDSYLPAVSSRGIFSLCVHVSGASCS